MQEFVLQTRSIFAPDNDRDATGKECVSQGIAALVPNDIRPDEIVDLDADFRNCRVLVLMQGEMNYEALKTRAEALRLQRVGSRENAELWLIRKAATF
jgi:hypothetical protein